MGYYLFMIEILQTYIYRKWFSSLRDGNAKARIDVRLRRLSLGNFGDVRPVGQGVSEIKIDYGPGYRIYFLQKGDQIVVLLAGGDKSTQQNDIQLAHQLAEDNKE
jgi:putative addiction module killer protein